MSQDLFKRVKSLLQDHIDILNQHRLGDSHVEDAQAIIDEITILLQSNELKNIEHQIDEVERKLVSDDLAEEILNGKYCVGGSCED
jgi:hypothetical protein